MQQLRSEQTELNYQKMQLEQEKQRLQDIINQHAQTCPNFRQQLEQTRPFTTVVPVPQVSTISTAPCNDDDDDDQQVPYQLNVTEGTQKMAEAAPVTMATHLTVPLPGSVSFAEESLIATTDFINTGVSIPRIEPSVSTNVSGTKTEVSASPCIHQPQLGTETLDLFQMGMNVQNIDETNTHLLSNAISLATTTVQEQHDVQNIIDSKYGLSTEAGLTDSGKSTPQSLNRQTYPNNVSPCSQYSEISAEPCSPVAPADHTPPSPNLSQLPREQIQNTMTVGTSPTKGGNIPLMVLEQNPTESEQSSSLNVMCDTMEFGIGILKNIVQNKDP